MSPLLLKVGLAHYDAYHNDRLLWVVYFWNMLGALSCWYNASIFCGAFRNYPGV